MSVGEESRGSANHNTHVTDQKKCAEVKSADSREAASMGKKRKG